MSCDVGEVTERFENEQSTWGMLQPVVSFLKNCRHCIEIYNIGRIKKICLVLTIFLSLLYNEERSEKREPQPQQNK